MSEQILVQPVKNPENSQKAFDALERARAAHERYLLRKHNNDLDEAIEYYINAVKLDPTMPESYYRLATLMWEQGQISLTTAIEQCKTAVSLAPQSADAHLYAGYFMKMAEDFQAAEKEFKSAIKINRMKSGRPRLIMSQTLLQKINAKNAGMNDYVNFVYYFLSGSLMLAWDKPSLKMFCKNMSDDFSVFSFNAVGKFLEKFKLRPAAENVYKKAADETGHTEIFYNRMGDLALKNKEAEMTVGCYRKALEANPLNREVLIKLATVLQTFFPESTDEAIECYETLLQFKMDTAQIYYELGHLYLRKEDKLHSISAFKLALENDTENPFYNNSLAYAYTKAELYDEAIEHYQKAVSLNPDPEWTSIVCQALGAIYGEIKGNTDAAVSTYQAGIILDPANYDLYISLGDIYMSEYDLDKAIRAYCDAITLEPHTAKAYEKAGVALWEKDYIEEALVSFHKAIDLDPDNAFSYNNLGVLYLDGFGDPMEALEYFEQAIDMNPNYTIAYFNAGRASHALGFINDAARYYQRAIDLNKLTEDLDEHDITDRLHRLFDI
ncbi:MAG: tetratricopeptide repeat protein [Heliobacteriaceae bacterium]|jgi:tetratricopeptide (TPR) repeat protein|nr:tetratricopeptide repeat protein [Heliobacteriaceae bacterium]